MAHLFEPAPVNDAFGDPGICCDFRDERRAILLDLGDISALPPRKLMRLTHVFVTHTHMDHFAGFDHLLRVVLGRKERIVLTGGPGFVDQVEHKLRAYTWNVVHRYEMPLELVAREPLHDFAPAGDVLHEEPTFRVRGRFVDHEMPCIAYAIEERARVNVAPDRLKAMGIGPGAWLRALKQAVLAGVDLLFIESVLDADAAHGARKNHLTARQAGLIARRLGARHVVPFHFSPRYEGRAEAVRGEALAAWTAG